MGKTGSSDTRAANYDGNSTNCKATWTTTKIQHHDTIAIGTTYWCRKCNTINVAPLISSVKTVLLHTPLVLLTGDFNVSLLPGGAPDPCHGTLCHA